MERCVGGHSPQVARRSLGGPGGFISVAFLAGLVFVPFVVATGLLSDARGGAGLPADLMETPLRGTLDVASRIVAPTLPRRK